MEVIELEKYLDEIYYPLEMKASAFTFKLSDRIFLYKYVIGMSYEMQWENDNSKRISYPIPIIKIKYLCDVEFFLSKIIITARISISDARQFDFQKLKNYNYALYGCREYPFFFYDNSKDIEMLKTKFKELKEKAIGIQIYLKADVENDEILAAVKNLRKQNVFYYNTDKKTLIGNY